MARVLPDRGGTHGPFLRTTSGSETELSRELHEPRRHERLRPQPGGAVGVVVRQGHARIRHVVEIDPDVGARPAEAQDLGDPEIELASPDRRTCCPGLSRLTVDVGGAARERTAERLRHRRAAGRPSSPGSPARGGSAAWRSPGRRSSGSCRPPGRGYRSETGTSPGSSAGSDCRRQIAVAVGDAELTRVGDPAPRARPALHRQPALEPGVDVDVHAVPVVGWNCRSSWRCVTKLSVLPKAVGEILVRSLDHVAAAAGQPRVERRRQRCSDRSRPALPPGCRSR